MERLDETIYSDKICCYCGGKARFREEWFPPEEEWRYFCSDPFYLCPSINGIAERIRPRKKIRRIR